MRIRCSICGRPVSSEVADGTVVRAWIECVECIEKQIKESDKKKEVALYGNSK